MWVNKCSKMILSKVVPRPFGVQKPVVLGCFELFSIQFTHASSHKLLKRASLGPKKGQEGFKNAFFIKNPR